MSMFQKATREQLWLRMALVGPAGSGKTFSMLRLLSALLKGMPEDRRGNGRIAIIDTEHGSASLYAGQDNPDGGVFDFDVVRLDQWRGKFSVENYNKAIKGAQESGYRVIGTDSLSHAWSGPGGILEFVDSKASAKGGKFSSGWRQATPMHNELVDNLLSYDGHLVSTMRSKVEYVVENGKVRKLGMQPVQRGDLDFEFTVVGDMDNETHTVHFSKTRCSELAGQSFRKPGADVAEILLEWLNKGAEASEPKSNVIPPWSDDERVAFVKAFADVARKMDSNAVWGFDPYLLGYTADKSVDLATYGDKRNALLGRLRKQDGWDAFDAWCRANESKLKGAK